MGNNNQPVNQISNRLSDEQIRSVCKDYIELNFSNNTTFDKIPIVT